MVGMGSPIGSHSHLVNYKFVTQENHLKSEAKGFEISKTTNENVSDEMI